MEKKTGGHECKNYQGSSITLLLEKKVQQGSFRGQELYKITHVRERVASVPNGLNGLQMGLTNHLLTGMILQVGVRK